MKGYNNMNKNKIHVLITAFTAGNLGDDMFITLLCRHYPFIHFVLQCPKQFSLSFQNLPNLTLVSNISKSLVACLDFQIFIGGSLFMEPQNVLDIKHKFNNVISCRVSSNIPFFVIGANFGPYTQPTHLKLYQDWFKQLNGICFRDKQSYNLFKDLPHTMWAPDLLFSYPLPKYQRKRNNITIAPIYNTNRIGLPNFDNEKYLLFLKNISVEYLKRGYSITLAAFCISQLDNIACQKIYESIPGKWKNSVHFIEYKNDIDDFLTKFLHTDYIIGTRFHSIILALKARIPVFPIIYNTKTFNAIKSYHYAGNYADIMHLNQIDFNTIHANKDASYTPDYLLCEVHSKLHFHYFNEELNAYWRNIANEK